MAELMPCPCGSSIVFVDCCELYIVGGIAAPTAEALMRSRYTAYTLRREDYLLATWHVSTRPTQLGFADEMLNDISGKWLGLEVKKFELQDSSHATVEFVARYKVGGRAHRLHELSSFVCENGKWFYVDGDMK
ncbi:MAG: YchJ family metal-binding protein [Gallionella sp.]